MITALYKGFYVLTYLLLSYLLIYLYSVYLTARFLHFTENCAMLLITQHIMCMIMLTSVDSGVQNERKIVQSGHCYNETLIESRM